MNSSDWAGSSGDIWAGRWRDTDRALAAVGAALDEAVADAAPAGPFRALDVGCGPGTTSLALAARRPDADILGCDLSQALVEVARQRLGATPSIRFIAQDAERAARDHGPFDLIYSRHGVMFFDDPSRALRTLRDASREGGRLVFSCFGGWADNPWAAELASAAAGRPLPPPGREPGAFAFAEPGYVSDILASSGWADAEPQPLPFRYVAGEGPDAAEQALSFLSELGPAARILADLEGEQRCAAVERMRGAIRDHERDGQVTFAAAAWIWRATAAGLVS